MNMNTWVTTTDRDGHRAYALPTGQVVCKDGTGSMPVTVYYAGFTSWGDSTEVGMTDTVAEGKAWAEDEARHDAGRRP